MRSNTVVLRDPERSAVAVTYALAYIRECVCACLVQSVLQLMRCGGKLMVKGCHLAFHITGLAIYFC